MNLEDLKEQLLSLIQRLYDRLQDMPVYQQGKDRFDALSLRMQKAVIIGFSTFLWLLFLLIPYSWFAQSQDSVTVFEQRRAVVREMLKVSREASELTQIPAPPPVDSLKSDLDARLKQASLVPEQIKGLDIGGGASNLIAADRTSGSLLVNLWKLNLRQIVDVGTQLSKVSPSVKVTSLEIRANKTDGHYFDVLYKLTELAVPDFSAPPPDEPVSKSKPKKKQTGRER